MLLPVHAATPQAGRAAAACRGGLDLSLALQLPAVCPQEAGEESSSTNSRRLLLSSSSLASPLPALRERVRGDDGTGPRPTVQDRTGQDRRRPWVSSRCAAVTHTPPPCLPQPVAPAACDNLRAWQLLLPDTQATLTRALHSVRPVLPHPPSRVATLTPPRARRQPANQLCTLATSWTSCSSVPAPSLRRPGHDQAGNIQPTSTHALLVPPAARARHPGGWRMAVRRGVPAAAVLLLAW